MSPAQAKPRIPIVLETAFFPGRSPVAIGAGRPVSALVRVVLAMTGNASRIEFGLEQRLDMTSSAIGPGMLSCKVEAGVSAVIERYCRPG